MKNMRCLKNISTIFKEKRESDVENDELWKRGRMKWQ